MAARQTTEDIIEVRYNLCMLGFRNDEPAWLFDDNVTVVLITTMPSSMLVRTHHSFGYHRCREVIAASIALFVDVASKDNVADVLSKSLPAKHIYR